MNMPRINIRILVYSCIFLSALFVVLNLYLPEHVSRMVVLKLVARDFYRPNHNEFPQAGIDGTDVHTVWYTLVISASLALFIAGMITKNFVPFRICLQRFVVVGCFWLVLFSLYGQTLFLRDICLNMVSVPRGERYGLIFKGAYRYALFSKLSLPQGKRFNGKFISDFDPVQTIQPYIIAYYLYPKVSLFLDQREDDCLIVFQKINARDFVPPGYRIWDVLDDKNLIAIKEY